MTTILPYEYYQRHMGLYPVANETVDAAVEHALHMFPEESCGIVIANVYYPMNNIHVDPKNDFEIRSIDYLALVEEHGPLQAVIHSHPQGQRCPSKEDMQSQIDAAVPYGIIVIRNRKPQNVFFWGEGCPLAPAEGRPFIHGVYDCYATVRDELRRSYNVRVADLPRNDKWWDAQTDNNVLADNYVKLGFTIPVDFLEMKPGDAVMGKLADQPRINHCGIYMGNGLILHHLFGTAHRPRFSIIEPIYSLKPYISQCLRHQELVQVPAS